MELPRDTDTLGFFTVPLAGPAVWRLQDDPPGTPAVAWEEVPRHKLRGWATHYTLCIQGEAIPIVCMNGELSVSPKIHLSSTLSLLSQFLGILCHQVPRKQQQSCLPLKWTY